MLAAELTHHLANEGDSSKNHRNGTSPKKVLSPGGQLQLDVPRDRLSSFEPKLVAKHQRRMPGFDDHVISMYARGMTVREIQGHLLELYGTEVSPDLISTITDEVIEEVTQWQLSMPAEPPHFFRSKFPHPLWWAVSPALTAFPPFSDVQDDALPEPYYLFH
jgi:transposase-like protein